MEKDANVTSLILICEDYSVTTRVASGLISLLIIVNCVWLCMKKAISDGLYPKGWSLIKACHMSAFVRKQRQNMFCKQKDLLVVHNSMNILIHVMSF